MKKICRERNSPRNCGRQKPWAPTIKSPSTARPFLPIPPLQHFCLYRPKNISTKIVNNNAHQKQTHKQREIRKNYMSKFKRFSLMRSPMDESSSEPMGREKIPKARSINSTIVNINSIDSTNATVEDLFP